MEISVIFSSHMRHPTLWHQTSTLVSRGLWLRAGKEDCQQLLSTGLIFQLPWASHEDLEIEEACGGCWGDPQMLHQEASAQGAVAWGKLP